jgi:acyl-CoA synthetase (AMP-forming)/AMP-acid ligase II
MFVHFSSSKKEEVLMLNIPTNTRRLGESEETFMNRLRAFYDHDPLTMPNLLKRSVVAYPDKTALVDASTRLTYEEVENVIGRFMNGLIHTGLRKGKTIGLMMGNHVRYVLSYFSIINAGGIVVPLNVRLSPREIAYILRDAGVETVVADNAFAGPLTEALHELADVSVIWNGSPGKNSQQNIVTFDDLLQYDPIEPNSAIKETDLSAIYYTSGTTGFPKGATLSHLNMVAVARQNVEAWCFDSPDVLELEISPLFHVSFQEFGPPVLHVGGTLVVDTFSPRRALQFIEDMKINAMFAVPSMIFMMASVLEEEPFDTSSIRIIKYGGSTMPPERLKKVQEMFPNAILIQGFGQTESTGMIAVNLPEETTAFPRSTGRAISGSEIRIVDDDGNERGLHEIGEILSKGPQVMIGYHQNDKANAETLKDGWLHTGDLGYLDEEGRLYVVDRKKDLIIRGGQNIYSVEVEEVLYQHPNVSEAAVIGKVDDTLGEVVMAIVIPGKDGQPTAEDLINFCRGQLASYKVPVAIQFVEEFPRTSSGKIRKVELRQMYGGLTTKSVNPS